MSTKPPSFTLDKKLVRFPDGMRNDIESKARSNHRSVNSEIIYALDIYLYPNGKTFTTNNVNDSIQSEDNYSIEDEYKFIKSIDLKCLTEEDWEVLNKRLDKLKVELIKRINSDSNRLSDLITIISER